MMYVYLMKANNLYKIGQSTNPEKRLKSIKTGNPHIKLICYGRNYNEKQMHKMFKRYRVSGEWFDLPQKAVTWIEYNIGDKAHVLKKRDNKKKYEDYNNDFADYVILFGKYKDKKITSMTSEEQLRYIRNIFLSHQDKDSYVKKVFKWWYLYYTNRDEKELNYNTSDINLNKEKYKQ